MVVPKPRTSSSPIPAGRDCLPARVPQPLSLPSRRILEERERSVAQSGAAQDEKDSDDFDLDEFLDNLDGGSDGEEQLAQEEDLRVVGKELRELPVESKQVDDEVPDIPPELRRELYRIHRNLGHPDPKRSAGR